MKRRPFAITLITICLLVVLGACASAQPTPDGFFGAAPMATPMPAAAPAAEIQFRAESMADTSWLVGNNGMRQNMVFEDADFLMSEGEIPASERRISTTANIDMETDELESAISAVRELVWVSGGFIEQANFLTNDRHLSAHSHNWRQGSSYNATLRVPGENYESFLEGLRGIGEITRLNETTQDHTAVFFDTTIRLETREIEEERLLELIERARYSGEISDLLELEGLLRNVRLEIEGLTRQIDHIDRLVAFHTIRLTLFETEEPGIIAATTLIDRAGEAFIQSIDDIVSLSRNFTIFFASIIAPTALLAAIIIIIRTTRRKLKKS